VERAPVVVIWPFSNLDFTSVLWLRYWHPVYIAKERNWKCKLRRGIWKEHAPHMFYESHSRNHKKNHLTSETDLPLCLQLENACTFSSKMKNTPRPIQWKRKFHFILGTVRRGWRKNTVDRFINLLLWVLCHNSSLLLLVFTDLPLTNSSPSLLDPSAFNLLATAS